MRFLWIAALLVVVAGASAWAAWGRSVRNCQEAAFFVSQVHPVLTWVRSAKEDPFFAPFLRLGASGVALKQARAKAMAISALHFQWHLSPEFIQKAKELGRSDDLYSFGSRLEELVGLKGGLGCEPRADSDFLELMLAGERYWKSRKNEVRMAKLSFRSDKEIFCNQESLIEKLKVVHQASVEKCAQKKRGCLPGTLDSVVQEITDLERQKSLNLEKIRRKWPLEIREELKCSSI